jgi:hypothetical protein
MNLRTLCQSRLFTKKKEKKTKPREKINSRENSASQRLDICSHQSIFKEKCVVTPQNNHTLSQIIEKVKCSINHITAIRIISITHKQQ